MAAFAQAEELSPGIVVIPQAATLPDLASELFTPPKNTGNTLPAYREYRATAYSSIEKEYLQKLICISDKDLKKACRISGFAKSRLYELLKKHGLTIARP